MEPAPASDAGGAVGPVLIFLGAAQTVTGSRFLIDTPDARVLVECGLFQGLKRLRARNWAPFPVEPASIDAVVVTHAHLDHCGYLPALHRDGFRGPVHATAATASLARIVLPDSGHLQEEEARFANRAGYSKHRPALPLYTEQDAWRALEHFSPVPFDAEHEIAPGVHVTFRPAGHILGSATATVRLASHGDRRVTFSGDLGRPHHPLLVPPAPLDDPDLVVVESTHGNREHDDERTLVEFRDAITRTLGRGGCVLVPAFAVDRTEVVLFHLRALMASNEIPRVPVYVDSPMALASLAVYQEGVERGAADVRPSLHGEDPMSTGTLLAVHDVEESKALDRDIVPSIIVSASGMATGGRVLHHLKKRLPNPRNTVLLVGFQAEGTRGRTLAEGAREVKMHGRYVPVRAEVVYLPGFSVHADRRELLAWLGTATRAPETAFVVHGEADSAESLAEGIAAELGWSAVAARDGEHVLLDDEP